MYEMVSTPTQHLSPLAALATPLVKLECNKSVRIKASSEGMPRSRRFAPVSSANSRQL